MSRTSTRFRGTVLSMRNVGESDRVIDLLTEEYGRIDAWARGARRSKKRFGGALDRLQTVEGRLLQQGDRYSLQEASCPKPRLRFRSSLTALDEASNLLQLTRHGVPHGPDAAELSASLERALDALEVGRWEGVAKYYAELLAWSGSLPDAARCAHCEAALAEDAYLQGPGQLHCEACVDPASHGLHLGGHTLRVVRHAGGQGESPDEWKTAAAELAALLRSVHQGLSGERLPALAKLSQVEA